MKNPYNLERAQKKKEQEQVQLEQEMGDEIMDEAAKLEQKNYEKTRAARKRLEKSAQKQQKTTDEIRRQGRTIRKSKGAALNVHENVGKAEGLAEDIEKESHLFSFGVPFWGSIKKWWNKDRAEINEVDRVKGEMEEYDSGDEPANEIPEEYEEKEEGEEYVPGQKKTDKELNKILHTVRNINSEAKAQSEMAKKQKTDLKDINRLNEYSKKKTDKTDAELKKGL